MQVLILPSCTTKISLTVRFLNSAPQIGASCNSKSPVIFKGFVFVTNHVKPFFASSSAVVQYISGFNFYRVIKCLI